ncbi:MAG: hypothetical protein PHX78_04110 [bacterium]|nr:hypothetical protein [bacterium]
MDRKIIVLLFIITISILFVRPLKSETVPDSASEYAKKEIVFIKWGDGENEVELEEEDVEDSYGGEIIRITPKGIKVDGKGNIYFEDSVTSEIVKYNIEFKKIEKYKSSEGIFKILVDKEQDGLYILNSSDNSVDVILTGKDRAKKINRAISDFLLKSDLKIKNKILFSGTKKKISFDETDTSNIELLDEKSISEYDLSAKNSLVKYKVIEPLYTYYFYNLKKIGAACDEIKYKTGYSSEYLGFINVDKNKNIYYLFSKSPIIEYDPIQYFIVKMDPAMCKIDIIFLEIDKFTGYMVEPREYVDVDYNGNIYQLVNEKYGVHILCWRKQGMDTNLLIEEK